MAVPSNAVYANGPTPVQGDQYNTFLQGVPTIAALRQFVGKANMQTSLLGLTSSGDGGAGTFWWNPASTAPDDGMNIVVPPAAASGAWNRLPVTAIFSSGDFSGPPILPGFPIGQSGNVANSVVEITTETVQPSLREFALSVNMTSSVGSSSSVASAANKVAGYFAIEATAGSGNVWAFNGVTVVDPTACAIGGVQVGQLDLWNLSGTDYNTAIDSTGLTQPSAVALRINGIGTNANSAAISVSGNSVTQGGAFAAGIVFDGGSTNRASVLDTNSPFASYKITGSPTYGFDTANGSPSSAAIRLGAQQLFAFRNNADSADLPVISTDGSDAILFGGAGTALLAFESAAAFQQAATFSLDVGVTGLFTAAGEASIAGAGQRIAFFGVTRQLQQTVTGSRGGNAALDDLLAVLAAYGLVIDSTTA